MKSTILMAVALVAIADALPDMHKGTPVLKARASTTARHVQIPSKPAALDVMTSQGCFKSSGNLTFITTPRYNSLGGCGEQTCKPAGYTVGATTGGNQCWCGFAYPPKSDRTQDGDCNFECNGFPFEACGADGFFSVYNTGLKVLVPYAEGDASSSSSSASPTAPPTSVETAPEKTLLVTQTATNEPSSGGGSNTAGIVAGVVVGVVVIACAVGGVFLYMRRKRNKEIEEEHRRNAAVNAFIGKPPGSSAGSMTDSRLDPVMAHRRMSDGSIADNQDYSRRILRVTNA